jgi:hypothetical protein
VLLRGAEALLEVVEDVVDVLGSDGQAGGVPDFSGLQVGDYFDLPPLSDGSQTITGSADYKNLRIVIAGFNAYKHMGATENDKNHIARAFENCPVTKAMNTGNDNTGGYPAMTGARQTPCGRKRSERLRGVRSFRAGQTCASNTAGGIWTTYT